MGVPERRTERRLLGTLRAGDIRFSPALAPARQRAIETLRMGLLNKCWLRFDRVLWPPQVDWIEWLAPRDGYWCQWLSLTRATQQPVLQAFNAGARAKELESLDDAATLAAAHDALRHMFGNHFPAPRWPAPTGTASCSSPAKPARATTSARPTEHCCPGVTAPPACSPPCRFPSPDKEQQVQPGWPRWR